MFQGDKKPILKPALSLLHYYCITKFLKGLFFTGFLADVVYFNTLAAIGVIVKSRMLLPIVDVVFIAEVVGLKRSPTYVIGHRCAGRLVNKTSTGRKLLFLHTIFRLFTLV